MAMLNNQRVINMFRISNRFLNHPRRTIFGKEKPRPNQEGLPPGSGLDLWIWGGWWLWCGKHGEVPQNIRNDPFHIISCIFIPCFYRNLEHNLGSEDTGEFHSFGHIPTGCHRGFYPGWLRAPIRSLGDWMMSNHLLSPSMLIIHHPSLWFWLYWTSRFVHVTNGLRLSGLLPWMFHVWQDADVHPLPATGFAFHSLFLRVSCHEVGMLQKPSKNGRCLKDDRYHNLSNEFFDSTIQNDNHFIQSIEASSCE